MIRAERFTVGRPGTAPHLTADLHVLPGEVVLLTGATGSGKTLLLHALAGLRPPSLSYGGILKVAGHDALVASPQTLARDVALVFQDASDRLVQPDVEGALAFRLENLATPAAEVGRRVGDALRGLGLAGFRDTATLSEGEAKAVALEAALACAPRVLLLDEPLAGLDAQRRAQLLDRLRALRGVTTLVVEHRARDVLPVAHRHLHIEDGVVQEVALARA